MSMWTVASTGAFSPGGASAVRLYLASPEAELVERTEASREASLARRPL